MKVYNKSQPTLLIAGLGVEFVDGVAEVTQEQFDALGAYTVHGVLLEVPEGAPADAEPADDETPEVPETEGETPEAPEVPEGAPAATANRGQWAKYAESLGIETGDMTKAEIITAVKSK